MINVNDEAEFRTLIEGDKPVLVDFYADWCGPCKMLTPILEELSGETSEITICKVNVDNHPQLAQEFAVQSIPTIISFKNGELHKKAVGLQPKSELLKLTE